MIGVERICWGVFWLVGLCFLFVFHRLPVSAEEPEVTVTECSGSWLPAHPGFCEIPVTSRGGSALAPQLFAVREALVGKVPVRSARCCPGGAMCPAAGPHGAFYSRAAPSPSRRSQQRPLQPQGWRLSPGASLQRQRYSQKK